MGNFYKSNQINNMIEFVIIRIIHIKFNECLNKHPSQLFFDDAFELCNQI